ncbi:MAG: hypothetical protein H7Y36_08640 [Armatimonadetes bacterium]|nr:hypothetical protein [Akkermansiaceae bacterium]
MDTVPEISLGSAALIIFAISAGFMILRGIARTLVNTAFFTISAWIGFRVWQQSPALAIDWTGKTSPFITTGLPVVAFLASLFLLRKIVNFFRAPFGKSSEEASPKSPFQLGLRLLFTLVPTALICLTAATFIHHASAISEIKESAQRSKSFSGNNSLAERLKNSLSVAIPSGLMDWLDPLSTHPRLTLAKMIAANSVASVKPVINPTTGQPYPRAIIVDDPELQSLAKEGRFSTLLRHPLLSEALKDPIIREALGL